MPAKTILLVNDDPSLLEFFQNSIPAAVLSIRDTSRLRQKLKHRDFPLVILETKKDWTRDLKRLVSNGNHNDRYMIIGSSGMLKLTAGRINEITTQLIGNPSFVATSQTKPVHQKAAPNLALEEFMEHRLKDFVKQMKASGGRNLHPMLLREIERPLITITLRETNGNQIQAAHLLGMNRNTLRKKIKELKIRVYKNRQNNA
ncbi:MAG TPA: helix-turn-helix domain-containing protein [Nitrospiria bacterium]|nr:helix-turn-helix domain-containing protein [Nitrospiria bacterium]